MTTEERGKVCPECNGECGAEVQYCPGCGFPVGAVNLTETDPLIGSVLPGSYQVLDLLGVGGMGRVYRAEQRTLGRTVAIKVIHPHLASDEKSLARFLTEARATSKLNHPNSVSVIDFGKTDAGQPYLVMEFLRGKNLAQVAATEGLLELPRISNVLRQILAALGEAHELQIIHRDLKPENIVLEPLRRGGDFVKVVDFGLAKLKADEAQTDITLPGIVCGTPDFMAPEQGRGDPLDGRSDLYAVGVMLFWLLTGRLPFEASSPTQVVMMHITMPVPDPQELVPDREIPPALLDILYKALAKDPNQRFADAHEFSDALEAAASEARPTLAPALSERHSSAGGGVLAKIPERAIRCPECGHIVPHARFCFDCGIRLPRDTERPPTQVGTEILPLIGREEEMRWLMSEWQNASAEVRAVRLIGELGTGRTRLLDEFDAKASAEGARVVRAGPDPYWAEVSGFTLRALVRTLLPQDILSQGAPGHRVIHAILEELLLGKYANALSADERQLGYADTLRWSMVKARETSNHSLLVMIDDLDRVDALSRQAIAGCLREWHAGGLLVVAAHSPRFGEHWVNQEVRVLSGLPAHAATNLLNQMSQGAPRIALAELGSSGIPPLYVEQVLSFGIADGSPPPARLGDLIAERLATLGPSERRRIQGLAVLGDHISAQLLARFLGQEEQGPAHEQETEKLVECRLARFEKDGTVSLAHPLLHEIALLATPAEVRCELHRKAAQLFRADGAPLEVLAEHAVLSRDPMVALALLEQAATEAEKRGDDLTATNLLSRGLDVARAEIFRGELEDPMRAIVIFGKKLGATLMRRCHFSDAKGVLVEALDNTSPVGTVRAEILAQLSEVSQRRGALPDAARYLDEAQEVAARSGASPDLLEGLSLRRAGLRASMRP